MKVFKLIATLLDYPDDDFLAELRAALSKALEAGRGVMQRSIRQWLIWPNRVDQGRRAARRHSWIEAIWPDRA